MTGKPKQENKNLQNAWEHTFGKPFNQEEYLRVLGKAFSDNAHLEELTKGMTEQEASDFIQNLQSSYEDKSQPELTQAEKQREIYGKPKEGPPTQEDASFIDRLHNWYANRNQNVTEDYPAGRKHLQDQAEKLVYGEEGYHSDYDGYQGQTQGVRAAAQEHIESAQEGNKSSEDLRSDTNFKPKVSVNEKGEEEITFGAGLFTRFMKDYTSYLSDGENYPMRPQEPQAPQVPPSPQEDPLAQKLKGAPDRHPEY